MIEKPFDVPALSDNEKALAMNLRKEASEVKDCFTRFSFQAIAFTAPVLAIIANYIDKLAVVAVGSTAIVSLILAVARIGIYKYGTANRNFGYELHLQRTRYVQSAKEEGWKPHMREIGWEEALRAWRIVQATVFEHLYYTRIFNRYIEIPNYLKIRHRRKKYNWFTPGKQVIKGTAYYAGSYLETMLNVLHTLTLLAVTPLLWATYQLYLSDAQRQNLKKFVFAITLCVLLLGFILMRRIKDNAKRKLLEGGILCIHSSAIMWQAVVIAHYRALSRINSASPGEIQYRRYTRALSREAQDLKKHIFKIHDWIDGTCSEAEISKPKTKSATT
jgi:hypothetical protein